MVVVKVHDEITKHHGGDTAAWIDEIRKQKDNKGIEKKMQDFAEKHGSDTKMVGGLSGALLEGFKRAKDNNTKATYGSAMIYLAKSLNEKNEELMGKLDVFNKAVEKKGGTVWAVPRDNKIEDMMSFSSDLMGMEIKKNTDNMLSVRNGAIPVKESSGKAVAEETEKFMKLLMSTYYRSGYAVGIGNVITGVTSNLAIWGDEVRDRINRATAEAESLGIDVKKLERTVAFSSVKAE
ncbi:hypothetical protein H0N98_03060 [Candidatus Micrarchaeota archaeon]|nr:hypothetical protein [Candidatus Micrarchaeota archaeon]